MTEDKLLADSVTDRIKDTANAKVLPSIEDLKGLINTLVSEADESYIDSIRDKCKTYFFQKNNKETFYYKEEVKKKLKEQYEEQLEEVPSGYDSRENGTWYIGAPQFVKKEGQRIFWATTITVEAEAFIETKEHQQEIGKEQNRRLSDLLPGGVPMTQRGGLISLVNLNQSQKIPPIQGSL